MAENVSSNVVAKCLTGESKNSSSILRRVARKFTSSSTTATNVDESEAANQGDLQPTSGEHSEDQQHPSSKISEPGPAAGDDSMSHVTDDKLRRYEAERDKLQAQVQELQKELRDNQDFVFALQHGREQITETEAAAEYKFLYQSIQDWVETQLGQSVEKKLKSNNNMKESQVRQANNFVRHVPRSGVYASQVPGTDEFIIISVIMRIICEEIFDREFCCWVEGRQADWVRNIQESMTRLEPPRDIFAIRSWRSETLTAIASMPGFTVTRDRKRVGLVSELISVLSIFSTQRQMKSPEFISSIERAIVAPALQLADKLHLSVDKYSFEWSRLRKTSGKKFTKIPSTCSEFECKDVQKSGKVLTAASMSKMGDIIYLLDVAPALVLERAKPDGFAEPKIIMKPKILVSAIQEGEITLIPAKIEEGKHATLVNWMLDSLQETSPETPAERRRPWSSLFGFWNISSQ